MKPELFKEVTEIFLAVRANNPETTSRLLTELCGQREDLRREVARLLAQDGQRGDGLDDDQMHAGLDLEAVRGLFTTAGSPSSEAWRWDQVLPKAVGQYRIIRRIGEGGMGIVCEAEQDNPRRLVAIKLLRSGPGSRVLIRRFAYEAQILARLHHPGIARIYEAGTAETPAGAQPYFAMELITGKPLFEHTAGMSIAERLKLFLLICDAVEYAHTKSVIHRDLKPANIIVDEHGHPRILDFGVALVTDADLQVTTMQTDPGQLVGTLPYMSPEQVSGQTDAVDTRTDVYALGIILFQLLSGRLPYDTRSKSIAEAARIIRDQEPTRLGSLDTAFRGDIDTIVSRTLEKDAARRYQSVAALAADVQRHLRHEPIEARPSSRLYQVGKFARRHPEILLGATAAAAFLIAGIVGTSWGLVRAMHQRDRATDQALQASNARKAAEQSAIRSSQLAAALRQVLAAAQPTGGSVRNESVAEMLTKYSEEIEVHLANHPEVEWEIRTEIGKTFRSLGVFPSALASFLRAHALGVAIFGSDSELTIESSLRVALTYADFLISGKATKESVDDGRAFMHSALDIARRVLGTGNEITLSLLDCSAAHEAYSTRYREALELDRELLAELKSLPAHLRPIPLSAVTGRIACNLAWCRHVEEAATCASEALALLPADIEQWTLKTSSDAGRFWSELMEYLRATGRHSEIIDFLRGQLERSERLLGHQHGKTCALRKELAGLLYDSGDSEGALPLLREHVAWVRRSSPRGTDLIAWDLLLIGKVYATNNQPVEAAAAFAEAADIARQATTRDLGWFAQEIWRYSEVGIGLGTYRRWPSEALRLESRVIMDAVLRGSPTSFDKAVLAWKDLSYRLVKHGESREVKTLGFQDLLTSADPLPGLYRFDLSVPFSGKDAQGGDWILVAPWRVRKYAHHCLDLTSSTDWATRLESSPDELVESSTLTGVGWWERGLGPGGVHYSFGLTADATVELPPGPYQFTLIADDGGTLSIDGLRVISAWTDQGGHAPFTPSTVTGRVWTAKVDITPGPHDFHVEYVQWGGASKLQLRIEPLALPPQSPAPVPPL